MCECVCVCVCVCVYVCVCVCVCVRKSVFFVVVVLTSSVDGSLKCDRITA